MAGMDKNKKLLLGYLEGGTVSLLVAVVLFRPFRDDENMNGYSGADRAEVIALLCYLGELAVASKCMRIIEDRENGKLKPFEDAAATLAGLFFVGFPGKPAVTHFMVCSCGAFYILPPLTHTAYHFGWYNRNCQTLLSGVVRYF